MLYGANGSNRTFPMLEESLRRLGVAEEIVAQIPVFLDTTKPLDISFLERIPTQDFNVLLKAQSNPRQFIDFETRYLLGQSIEKEFERTKEPELLDRCELLLHALFGSTMEMLLPVHDAKSHDKGWNSYRALEKRYSSPVAAAIVAARKANRWSRWMYKNDLQEIIEHFFPQTLFAAYSYCATLSDQIVLSLCLELLLEFPDPDQKQGLLSRLKGQQQPTAFTAVVARVRAIWERSLQGKHSMDYWELLMLATAMLTPYDEQLEEAFQKNAPHFAEKLLKRAYQLPRRAEQCIDAISKYMTGTEYALNLAEYTADNRLYFADGERLLQFVKLHPDVCRQALETAEKPEVAKALDDALAKVAPTYAAGARINVQAQAQEKCIRRYCEEFPDCAAAVTAYLRGETALETLLPFADKMAVEHYGSWSRKAVSYVRAFGTDTFAKRCICVNALIRNGHSTGTPGFQVREHEAELIQIMQEGGVPNTYLLRSIGDLLDWGVGGSMQTFRNLLASMQAEFVDCNRKVLSVTMRDICLNVFRKEPDKYKAEIFSFADDTSKTIRATLVEVLAEHPEWISDYLPWLTEKKAAKRELAVSVLAKLDVTACRADVQAAYDVEKKSDLKEKLGALLGIGGSSPAELNLETLVADLTKGNKVKKLEWLFADPFRPVCKLDGSEAETAYLQAILLCYANMTTPAVSPIAKQLAEQLQPEDMAQFALAVLGKWLDQGAPAKTKWVLYMAVIHGGYDVQETLLHQIKEWSENSRGSIACDAVKALTFKGTSDALMAVDNLSRKAKSRQVKAAAKAALDEAADALQMTSEELADHIVPNLRFDAKSCRVFDYGTRQFKVYLTPTQELEIYEGDKKLKNLPKPGAKDDNELATAAEKAFKEMKKQLKATVTAQKARLEYVLMCARTWDAAGWTQLFVKNPVMHSFAIGLIWGTYDAEGKLLASFRYMEDGSFNTADEDEYELPEQAKIGLVHPLELDAETLESWTTQLTDYEITQPFAQLTRACYPVQPDEIGKTELLRWKGQTVNNMSLIGKMQKLGWEKGMAQDAGWFYEFCRKDVMRREKRADGTAENIGYACELKHSGTSIAIYESEELTLEQVQFYALGQTEPLPLETVNKRYFSEILLQLTEGFGPGQGEN